MRYRLTGLFLFLLSATALGELIRNPYEGVRPTGMGGAFLAISDDNNALFYNPAGLAFMDDYRFNVIDIQLGVDSLDTLSRFGNAVLDGDFNNVVRQDRQFNRLSIRNTFFTPYMATSIFSHLNSFIELNNLESLNGSIDMYSFNDIGIQTGVGFPISDYFALGGALKVFHRVGVDATITALDLIQDLGIPTTTDLSNALFESLQNYYGTGIGIGINLGALVRIPLTKGPEIRFAAMAEDLGGITFRQIGNAQTPPDVDSSYHLGAAFKWDLKRGEFANLAIHLRHTLGSVPLIKQLHLGLEYQTPYFDVRAGLYQLHPTAGFSLKFPPHTRVHFSTYAPELGTSLWQKSQRWWVLQLIIGFNPI